MIRKQFPEQYRLSIPQILWFFVRFLVIFVLLAGPWPGLPKAYAPIYRAGIGMLFGWFGPAGNVQVSESHAVDADHDTLFVLSNWETDAEFEFAGSSLKGYEPTAFVLALILATPIPWPRRLWAALWGLALATLYAALRTGVFLVFAFSRDNDLAVFNIGPMARNAVEYVYWVVGESFAGWLLVPLPIWAVVCLWAARLRAGSRDT